MLTEQKKDYYQEYYSRPEIKEKRKSYLKKYYEEHHEKLLPQGHEYYIKHRLSTIRNSSIWQKTHLSIHAVNCKNYRLKHKEHIKNHGKEYRANLRAELISKILALFPTPTCVLCGQKDASSATGVTFHEKHGKKHDYQSIRKLYYIIEHHEDFVPLCKKCHNKVRWHPELLSNYLEIMSR